MDTQKEFRFNIFAPNRRSVIIEAKANTPVLYILEQACEKLDLNAKEYEIRHFIRVLDTNATVWMAGLPKNSELQLTKAKRLRTESQVSVSLEIEAGIRHMNVFDPTDTLWDVISKCPVHMKDDLIPSINYLRSEIVGQEALKATTIRSLGITGGRVLMRFRQTPFQPSTSSDNEKLPDTEKRKREDIEEEEVPSKRARKSIYSGSIRHQIFSSKHEAVLHETANSTSSTPAKSETEDALPNSTKICQQTQEIEEVSSSPKARTRSAKRKCEQLIQLNEVQAPEATDHSLRVTRKMSAKSSESTSYSTIAETSANKGGKKGDTRKKQSPVVEEDVMEKCVPEKKPTSSTSHGSSKRRYLRKK